MQTQQTTPTKSVYSQPKLEFHPERYNIVTQSGANGGGLPPQDGGGISGSINPLGF